MTVNAWIDSLPGPRVQGAIEKYGDMLMKRYHTTDVYFAVWLHAVNLAVQRRILLDIHDLEDWPYYDAYEGDMEPVDAAKEMLAYHGYRRV